MIEMEHQTPETPQAPETEVTPDESNPAPKKLMRASQMIVDYHAGMQAEYGKRRNEYRLANSARKYMASSDADATHNID